jgi:hypothetical protein
MVAMHSINLSEEIFARAQRLARARGFATVEAYFSDVVDSDCAMDQIEAKFTPEVVAYLDEISRNDASMTLEQVDVALESTRKAWLERNAG